MTHQAAWIKSKNAKLELGAAETPVPGHGELLVRVEVIGFNPIESKIQRFETHPITYPNVLGFSYAGTVEAVGPGIQNFAKGDRVSALRPYTKENDSRFGAFQQYALASVDNTSKLLPNTPLEAGAASIVNLATVAAVFAIFQGLDRPRLDGSAASSKGQKVLIYGGSSSCGGLAIKYAAAAGYEVVTTSSPKNMELVESLTPDAILDHTKTTEEIIQGLQDHGPYHKILDTIGLPPVTKIIAGYLSTVGGGSYNTLIPLLPGTDPIPDNVERRFESYAWTFNQPENAQARVWFYDELLPVGLESGVIVPTKPRWIDGGLQGVQNALDMMDRGEVSGCKLLLSPW